MQAAGGVRAKPGQQVITHYQRFGVTLRNALRIISAVSAFLDEIPDGGAR